MEDRFSQQLKKGVLEMLVLKLICDQPTYGYELILRLKEESQGRFSLKEGTLYPILYRLEDDGMIHSKWSQGEGRSAPKKMYEPTEKGREENLRRQRVWNEFQESVNGFLAGGQRDDGSREENEEICQCRRAAAESAEGCEGKSHE